MAKRNKNMFDESKFFGGETFSDQNLDKEDEIKKEVDETEIGTEKREAIKLTEEQKKELEEAEKRKENTKKKYGAMHFRDIIKEKEEFKSLVSKDKESIEVTQKVFAEYLQGEGLEFDGFYKLWRKKMEEEKKVADEVGMDGFQKADLTKYLMSYEEFMEIEEKHKDKMSDIIKRKERTRDMYEFMGLREMNIEYGRLLDGIFFDPAIKKVRQKTLIKLFEENDLDLDTFLEIQDRKEKEYKEEKEEYEKKQKAKYS